MLVKCLFTPGRLRNGGLIGAFCMALLGMAGAQTSTTPLKIIVGTAPGSAVDQMARIVGEEFKHRLNQSVVIDSKPGAGGIIAATTAKSAAPDGNTLLFANAAMAVTTPLLFRAATYDVARDFDMVGLVASTPMVIVANPAKGPKTLQEAIEWARKDPGNVVIGSTGRGSIPHLAGELLGQLANTSFRQVAMSNSDQGIQAVVNGDTLITVDGLGQVQQLLEAGRLRPLGITASKALPGLESMPLAKDTVPGLVVTGWFMFVAPKGTPPARINELNSALNDVLKMPEVIKKLQASATFPAGGTVQEAQEFLAEEKKRWTTTIQKIGLPRE